MKTKFTLGLVALTLVLSLPSIAFGDAQTINYQTLMQALADFVYDGDNVFDYLDPATADNNDNGVLDVKEFELLAAIFANAGHSAHTAVHEAYKINLARIQTDEGGLVNALNANIKIALASYVTLGDGEFSSFTFGSGCVGFTVSGSLGIVAETIAGMAATGSLWNNGANPNYAANYSPQPDLCSLCGDADGDGVTNIEEYNAAPGSYPASALNPLVTASGGDPGGVCSGGGFTFAGLGYSYNPDTDKVYYLNTIGLSWTCANQYAQGFHTVGDTQVDGNLVTIESAAENTFLVDNILTAYDDTVWAGGNDAVTEGTWVWASNGVNFWTGTGATGSAVGGAYVNWGGSEPNNSGNEDYMEINATGGWNDDDPASLQASIIEFTDLNGTPFTDTNSNDIPDQFEQLLSITTVTITPNTAELLAGLDTPDTQNFSAVSSDVTDTAFTWESDNTAVATVATLTATTAKVTAVGAGTATITATANTTAATGGVTVTVRVPEWHEVCDLANAFELQGTFLAGLGIDDALPENWADWDIDLGTGDGVPDPWAMYLLAYAICGDDNADAEAAYEANLAEVETLAAELVPAVTFLANSLTIVPQLQALVTALPTALGGACNGPQPALGGATPAQFIAGVVLPAVQDPDTADAVQLMQLLTGLVPAIAEWLAGMNTLSTEMGMTLGALLPVEDVNDAVTQFAQIGQVLGLLTSCPDASVSGPAASALAAMGINPLNPPLVTIPTYAAYQSAGKLSNEPLAGTTGFGAGDYNDDGVTNAEVAAAVQGENGDADDYVAGASGDFGPFWPGNPALPVGTMAVGLLVGAFAAGGAAMIRRRRK